MSSFRRWGTPRRSRALAEAAPAATGEQLAHWARAEFLFAGDPLDAIAGCIARLHDAEHDGLSRGPIQAAVERAAVERQDLWDGEGCAQAGDVFSDEDVAARLVRWRSVLGGSLQASSRLRPAGSDTRNCAAPKFWRSLQD
jgi:hypothetical protein